ncbi:hypothetical protein CALCODRAFT_504625, partial [Calocera cornea HHB12733]
MSAVNTSTNSGSEAEPEYGEMPHEELKGLWALFKEVEAGLNTQEWMEKTKEYEEKSQALSAKLQSLRRRMGRLSPVTSPTPARVLGPAPSGKVLTLAADMRSDVDSEDKAGKSVCG